MVRSDKCVSGWRSEIEVIRSQSWPYLEIQDCEAEGPAVHITPHYTRHPDIRLSLVRGLYLEAIVMTFGTGV